MLAAAQVGELQPAAFTLALPDDRAAVVIATAMAQIGLPYGAGSAVVVTMPATDPRRYAVRSTTEMSTAEAMATIADAAPGDVVVFAPLADGLWVVLTAG